MVHQNARALTHRNVYPFSLDLSKSDSAGARSANPPWSSQALCDARFPFCSMRSKELACPTIPHRCGGTRFAFVRRERKKTMRTKTNVKAGGTKGGGVGG